MGRNNNTRGGNVVGGQAAWAANKPVQKGNSGIVKQHGGGQGMSKMAPLVAPVAGKGKAKGHGKGQALALAVSQPKGHGKGKDKGNSGRPAPQQEPVAQISKGDRQRVVQGRVQGQVSAWKGTFGWIVPDAPVQHAAGRKNGGRIYMDQTDIETEITIGGRVSFFVYLDNTGLGAQHIIAAKEGQSAPVKQHAEKQTGKGEGKRSAKGEGKQTAKGEGKGKGQHSVKGDAERQRVVQGRVQGQVSAWKGTFGWIVPDAQVQHAAGKRNGGRIYMDQTDIETEITIGGRVSFFVYLDSAGLGAQHIVAAKESQSVPVKKSIEKQTVKGEGKKSAKGEGKKATKGEGKGKKAGKKGGDETAKDTPPDKSTRESLAESGQGVIVDWRNNIGWLKPDDPITRDDARQFGRHKGLLFVHSTDCDGELPLTNAQVMYTMYKDTHGLGAESVTVLEQGDGVKAPREPKAPREEGEGSEKKRDQKKSKDHIKKAKEMLQKSSLVKNNKLKQKGKGKGKGKGEDKANKGPSGPNLPRKRVSDTPLTGEVVTWKGRIGWIKPSEEMDHPDAAKRGGKLYAHIKDVTDSEEKKPELGMTVQFYLFQDSSGLGAEEIVML